MEQHGIAARGLVDRLRDQYRIGTVSRIRSVRRCAVLLFSPATNWWQMAIAVSSFAPDSPEHDFFRPGIRVETPGLVLLRDRDREGPVLGPNVQGHGSIGFAMKAMHFLIFLDEQFAVQLILAFIA